MSWRRMKPNHSTRSPGNWVFVDTETISEPLPGSPKKERHTFRVGVAVRVRTRKGKVVGEELFRIHSVEAFWEWLYAKADKHRPTWVYAHSLSFDATILRLWERFECGQLTFRACPSAKRKSPSSSSERRMRKGCLVAEEPPSFVRCFDRLGRVFVFCDTLNYWKCGLAELGKWVGRPKGTMPDQSAPDEEWWPYCEQDALIVRDAVMKLMGEVYAQDLGVWKTTAPSLAMAAYRHRFRGDEIVFHDDAKARAIERAAYSGGENECYWLGKVIDPADQSTARPPRWHPWWVPVRTGPIHVYDIQSAYPWAMQAGPLPRKLHGTYANPGASLMGSLLKLWEVCAVVSIDSPRDTYPVRVEGQTLHACGRFATALCGDELRRAWDSGHIKDCGYAAAYQRGDLFTKYVQHWWERKVTADAEGDPVGRELAKLFLNSLYGKFGQRRRRWELDASISCREPWGEFWHWAAGAAAPSRCRSIGWKAQRFVDEDEHPEAFPAICAVITARVRERMRTLRETAGVGAVLYQDTDAIHVTDVGKARLLLANAVQPGVLGALKPVGTFATADYRGIKDYALGGQNIIAGVRRNAVEVAPGMFEQVEFERAGTLLARPPDGSVVVGTTLFIPKREYLRGKVGSDGAVSPLRLDGACLPADVSRALWPEQVSSQYADQERQDRVPLGKSKRQLGDSAAG